MKKIIAILLLLTAPVIADEKPRHSDYFHDSEKTILGLPVRDMSAVFAAAYAEWLESLPDDQITPWFERAFNTFSQFKPGIKFARAGDKGFIVEIKKNTMANFVSPGDKRDWIEWGDLTTAILVQMRGMSPSLQKMNLEAIYYNVFNAVLPIADPHGQYIYPAQLVISKNERFLTSLGLDGIRRTDGAYDITGVLAGSSADRAGLKEGDMITKINGREVRGISEEEIHGIMNGWTPAPVEIEIFDRVPLLRRTVVLRRSSVVPSDIDLTVLDGNILDIVIHTLSARAVAQVREAITAHGEIGGIILDLRDTYGEDANALVEMAGLFIGNRAVIHSFNMDGTRGEEYLSMKSAAIKASVPVIALVDQNTALTAEALAAVLEDNNRAILVGSPTSGNAILLKTIDLPNKSKLRVGYKKMLTPSGRELEGRGILPVICATSINGEKQIDAMIVNILNQEFKTGVKSWYNLTDPLEIGRVRSGCPAAPTNENYERLIHGLGVELIIKPKIYTAILKLTEK